MAQWKRHFTLGLTVGLLCLAVILGFRWQHEARRGKYRDLLPAFYVMGYVKLHYYLPVSLTGLMKAYWDSGSIAGMLRQIDDPYTRYLNRFEYGELRRDTEGSFGGIGIFLVVKEGKLIITSVVGGSPGAQAGLQPGDRIVMINALPASDLGWQKIVTQIRGKAGTRLRLRIARGEGSDRRLLDVVLRRVNLPVQTVTLKLKADSVLGMYALIRIFEFAETTPADLERELTKVVKNRACRGLILDLRANPGGSLDAAVKVASYFLPEGTPVLYIQRRGLPARAIHAVAVPVRLPGRRLPVAVLVDRESASAAEILSGALKDRKAATLIGTRTYGKDLIQTVIDLPGQVAVTITIASYLTSGKGNIHHRGVQPDRIVEIPGARDLLLKEQPQKYLRMMELQEREAVKVLGAQMPAAESSGFPAPSGASLYRDAG